MSDISTRVPVKEIWKLLDSVSVEQALDQYAERLTVIKWLNSLPQLPPLDWSKAPAWAQCHVYNVQGKGLWTSVEVEMNITWDSGWRGIVVTLPASSDYSGYELPIGIDWRTTLQRRPQEETNATP